ncbi:thiamine pyrophosphate-binding protein [Nonomuraea sp. PA05]|uniref:thiamine pyrophosphate-binding protein n=1 Tax=Nonomuraea sp. PA05 TaxID=2604466 RepID=UPI0011DC20FD|nr:thiamine pyrophosphate-binding protein [Nonomuraea sp. PA05]TYB70293.1 thiamine pyrophosphate-binding protein [Nonomuraea sp. PA05]
MNGAGLVVEVLAAEGVTQVYGIPGTTIMDLLDAFARQDRIRYLSVRHEQVAASMADGFSRGSGRLGVCVASRGPGAMNLATAVGNAFDESVPLLALVGQVPGDVAGRDAFEELDVLTLFRPITRWQAQIDRAGRIPELLQRAVRRAVSGRPGPVLVSLPLDVLRAGAEARPQPRFRPGLPRPAAADARTAARVLAQAERPAVIIGGGVRTAAAAGGPDAGGFPCSITSLVERLGAPAVTTWSRKNQFPNDHPNFLGSLGAGAFPATERAIKEADAVLALGCRFSEFTTKRWTLLSPGTRLVHVDIDPAELGKVYPPEVGLHADATLAAADLLTWIDDTARSPSASDWLAGLRAARTRDRRLPDAGPPPPGTVATAALVRALAETLARTPATLVVDAPSTGVWIQRHLDFTRPGSHFASSGGAMAWGFPAALGIQLARPHERVICLSGDGSFWMVAQDLETAVRERIPVVTVVADNYAYGNTRDRQRTAHRARYLGVFHDNPDLAGFARLHGAHGERVTCGADLVPALERALASGKPAIVDVVQDRHEGLPPGVIPLPASRSK